MKRWAGETRAQAGQSLVEFALLLPILLIAILGVMDVGLAIRARLQLAQVTQQAAQYLVHHPEYADTSNGMLVAYMNSLSSYRIEPQWVSVSVGTSTIPPDQACAAATDCILQDTVKVSYPFPVIFPLADRLSVGVLSSGALRLGATASTVAATHAPQPTAFTPNPCVMVNDGTGNTNINKCPDLPNDTPAGWREVLWDPPPEVASLSLPVNYCITRSINGGPPLDALFYPGVTSVNTVTNNIKCVAPKPSKLVGGALYFVDDADYSGYSESSSLTYRIYAMQENGMLSPALDVTEAGPLP